MSEKYYVIYESTDEIPGDLTERRIGTTRMHVKSKEFSNIEMARLYKNSVHSSWKPRIAKFVEY